MGDRGYLYVYLLLILLTVPFLVFYSWIVSLISSFLIIPLIITARFLAGFGFIGMLFVGVTYFFRIIPRDYRKKKRGRTIVRILVMVILIVMFVVPTMEAINLIMSVSRVNLLNLLIGIYSFIIVMYIVPVWRGEKVMYDEGIIQKISKRLSGMKRKLKKAYYLYFTGDLVKAYSLDFLYLKARLDEYRIKTAWKLLPAVIVLLASIPTIAIIAVIATWRIMRNKANIVDKTLFILSIILATTYILLMITPQNINTYFWSIPYIAGSIASIILFVDAIIGILR